MIGGSNWGKRVSLSFLGTCLAISFLSSQGFANDPIAILRTSDSTNFWQSLTDQAKAAGLPTKFLLAMDPAFVVLEFDDLHAFAAEYHPEDHELVLNRSLSFNAAGGTLKPLASLTPRELGTLYHELFHAYFDYISSSAHAETAGPAAARLFAFARDRQQCLYQQVSITPIVQRKARTEVRFLTERESWEALNETWAVFVGWAVWNKLELQRGIKRGKDNAVLESAWVKRLKKADQDGDLIGYYEPEADAERSIARKRYLAPSNRITPDEVKRLLRDVLEYSAEDAARIAGAMQPGRVPLPGGVKCQPLVE